MLKLRALLYDVTHHTFEGIHMNDATGTPAPRRHFSEEEWRSIEQDPEFVALVAAKRRFIVPATVFFIVYYFALPISVGFAPDLMSRNVIGRMNLAYLFALSQFLVAWGIAFLYLRRAGRFDEMAERIRDKARETVP